MELNEKQKENKREDKKAFKKYILIVLCSMLAGFVIGMGSMMLSNGSFLSGLAVPRHVLELFSVYGGIVATILIEIVLCVFYRQTRTMFKDWDGEDEAVLERMEVKITLALWLTTLAVFLSYFFMPFGSYMSVISKKEFFATNGPELMSAVHGFVSIGSILFTMILMNRAQRKFVNLEKEINPEKSVSAYELKFQQKWMEESDEAEKFVVYKSAYKAYSTTKIVCSVCWIISVIGLLMFDTGFLPMILVLAIWFTLYTVYNMQTIYYTKHPSEVMK